MNLTEISTLKARIGWQGLTTQEYLERGDYFLVTGTDFSNGQIIWDACHYVEKSRYDQDKNIQLKIHDILVTKDGTIGKVAFVDNLSLPATLNSGVFVIRPKQDDSYNSHFLFYIFSSVYFKEFLRQLVAGSTINHLYQKDFISFKLPLPLDLEEQSAIASTLRDIDLEISGFETKLAKYQKIKQGMMENLLTGRIRLV
jgi:type I restriction enzyme S subunit